MTPDPFLRTFPFFSRPEQYQDWARLALETGQADPFCCTPVWQLSFHDAFAPARRLLIRETPDAVLAFAEHVTSRGLVFLTPIEPHWFFGSPLLGEGAVDMFRETLPLLEREYAPALPRIVLGAVRPGGSLLGRVHGVLGPGWQAVRHLAGIQGAASLEGGLDGFLSRRSGGRRRKIRQAFRRAGEQGVQFERARPRDWEEAARTYERMLAVEAESWKGLGQCGMAEEPSRTFYGILITRLALLDAARVIFARRGERDIGFIFGAVAGRVYRGQQFSFADDWRPYGLGNLLQVEQVRWLCEEGVGRYDMGPLTGPRMEYKAHWTEQRLGIETWVLERGAAGS